MEDITGNGKYYAPSIEEFHLGFTFEVMNNKDKLSDPMSAEGEWKAWTIDYGTLWTFSALQKLLNEKQIRVKRLDHDDIIECGWTYGDKWNNYRCYHTNLYMLFHDPEKHFVAISLAPSGGEIGKDIPVQYIFRGDILNKNELKFQMKRLGITDKHF